MFEAESRIRLVMPLKLIEGSNFEAKTTADFV
jgi:hypothetical protein